MPEKIRAGKARNTHQESLKLLEASSSSDLRNLLDIVYSMHFVLS